MVNCFFSQTRHGHGQMTFSSDAVYEGQWQFDKVTGYGTLKLPDGTIQEGTWKEGSLQGCALFTWPHGVTEYREYDTIRGRETQLKGTDPLVRLKKELQTWHTNLRSSSLWLINKFKNPLTISLGLFRDMFPYIS